ncbi:MAG: YbaB/EbfC family nucleoid-associated protein [Bacteroidia bacterium]|nr:YbaB/EbfC family nucleoid-associated protein [Bacteroidia bacterium]
MWDLLKMMKRVQNLAQELENITVVGEGAEGKVRIILSGHQQMKAVEIAPELLQEPARLEEGIIQAFHEARDKLQQTVLDKLGGEIPPFLLGNVGIG